MLITSVNSSSREIVLHESGHTFGALADEYSDPYPGWITAEYPNVTAQTNRPLIKWTSWILGTTPIPTPGTSAYTSLVGLFELRLAVPRRLSDGGFTFDLTGAAPHGFVLQASTNLSYWVPLWTSILASGEAGYTNSAVNLLPRGFYRAVIIP